MKDISGKSESHVHCEPPKADVLDSLGPNETIEICSNQPIPDGFVIVSCGSSMSCPNWSVAGCNTFSIKRPGLVETICSSSPIPQGYVVVSWGKSMDCPGFTVTGTNTKTIEKI